VRRFVTLRRLVAEIEKATRGKLSYQGRQYRLVVDVDFPSTPSRDSYEVASQREARVVLDHTVKEGNAPADLLRQASEKISRDWRATSSQPDGLVLLRRIPHRAAAQMDDGPAITPSQMKALRQTDWIEIEVVDQDDQPYPAHYRLELADSDVREGDLGDEGFLTVSAIEPGSCKLTLGDVKLANDTDQPPA